MPSIGPMEIVIILIIALIVLGPKKLPEVGRSVGRGMREFKGALTGESSGWRHDRDPDEFEDRPTRARAEAETTHRS